VKVPKLVASAVAALLSVSVWAQTIPLPPTFKVGDSWTVRVTDALNDGQNRVRNATLKVERIAEGRVELVAHGPESTGLSRVLTMDGNVVRRGATDFEPEIRRFSYPLEPGKSWSVRFSYIASELNRVEVALNATVVGWEEVKVPAGTFRAMKLTYDGHWDLSISYRSGGGFGAPGGPVKQTAWYVPEVKRLVRLERKSWRGAKLGVDEVEELVAYHVEN